MYCTEEEALKRWCSYSGSTSKVVSVPEGTWVSQDDFRQNCVGSDCMSWYWYDRSNRGFCGRDRR
jgi:hypothetical protein